MSDPDYSILDQKQVSTARKIIAAIDSYDALGHRSNDDVARIASSIGLSIWQFRRLVRVWHAYKDLRLLVLNDGKKKGGRRLSPQTLLIIDDEIRNPDNRQETKNIVSRVQARCRENGLSVPVEPTILRRIRAHRASIPEAFNPTPRISVGRLWIRLTTQCDVDGTITTNPCLLVAVALPEARILAYQVSFDNGAPASIGKLLHILVAQDNTLGEPRPIYLHPTDYFVAKGAIEELGLEPSGVIQDKKSFEADRGFIGLLDCYPVLNRPAPKSRRNSVVLDRHGNFRSKNETLKEIERAVTVHNASHMLKVPIKFGR